MKMLYTTPGGEYFMLYSNILEAGHTLIAGAQGSGKSTVISGLIHTAILESPADVKMILIDPKRVDMVEYRDLPHVLRYATAAKQIQEALEQAIDIMEERYDEMAERRLKEYDGSRLFVIIDEVADLMTDARNKRTFTPLIQRLAQLGRAARITVIMATQCCLRTVIDTSIKCNFPSRLALRTATAQDSRNVIDMKGAEQLPNPRTAGKALGIWRNGADIDAYVLPRYDEAERERVIDHWSNRRNSRKVLGWFSRKGA